MSHYCVECSNSGERGQSGMLDCSAIGCNAATERATLDAHLLALGRLHERDLVWAAYKLGQAKAQAWRVTETDPPYAQPGEYVWTNSAEHGPALTRAAHVATFTISYPYWMPILAAPY